MLKINYPLLLLTLSLFTSFTVSCSHLDLSSSEPALKLIKKNFTLQELKTCFSIGEYKKNNIQCAMFAKPMLLAKFKAVGFYEFTYTNKETMGNKNRTLLLLSSDGQVFKPKAEVWAVTDGDNGFLSDTEGLLPFYFTKTQRHGFFNKNAEIVIGLNKNFTDIGNFENGTAWACLDCIKKCHGGCCHGFKSGWYVRIDKSGHIVEKEKIETTDDHKH